jgi:hypothetical protein
MERFVKGDIDKHIVFSKVGQVTPELMNKVIDAIIYILKQ